MPFQKVKYQFGDEIFIIDRPIGEREIPLKWGSERGFIPSLKRSYYKILEGELTPTIHILDHESLLEHDFLTLLDHDPNCVDIETQIRLYYEYKKHTYEYYRDVWALFRIDGVIVQKLFEVKPDAKRKELLLKEKEQRKIQATEQDCRKQGWSFEFITERQIDCTRLWNIKKCLAAAKHFSPLKVKKKLDGVIQDIQDLVNEERMTIREIAERVDPFHPELDSGDIIALLKHQIYHGHGLYIDWDITLADAIISPDPLPIIPVYALPVQNEHDTFIEEKNEFYPTQKTMIEQEKNNRINRLNDDQLILIHPLVDQCQKIITEYQKKHNHEQNGKIKKQITLEKHKAIDSTIREFCKERGYPFTKILRLYRTYTRRQVYEANKQLVQPVANRFGKDGKKKEVLTYCTADPPYGLGESPKKARRIYKYYKRYKKDSENGLYPPIKKRPFKLHSIVETLYQQTINEWYNGKWGDILAAYQDFIDNKCAHAKREKLIPSHVRIPAYTTFYKQIQRLPNVELKGTQGSKRSKTIPRVLTGTFKEGIYPAAVIQMDHTPLDIWIQDDFSGQVLIRPWITFAVCTFSHSICGFYITPDHQTQESVMQCIMNIVAEKKTTDHWSYFIRYIENNKLKIDPNEYIWQASGLPGRIQVDNEKTFTANAVKKFCMKHNITLSFRPVKRADFGGFVESAQGTLNQAIRRTFRHRGAIFPRHIKEKPPYSNYDPKKVARKRGITIDVLKEWVAFYIIYQYSRIPHGGEVDDPNTMWVDALRGDNHHPLRQAPGGALRILNDVEELKQAAYEARINADCLITEDGLRKDNMFYTSRWYKQIRKDGGLKDGERIRFQISDWDRIHAWVRAPVTGNVKILTAYNYYGDSRIKAMILDHVRLGIPLSKKTLDYANRLVKVSEKSDDDVNIMFTKMGADIKKKGRIGKRETTIISDMLKTTEGRDLLALFIQSFSNKRIILEQTLEAGFFAPDEYARLHSLLEQEKKKTEHKKKVRTTKEKEDIESKRRMSWQERKKRSKKLPKAEILSTKKRLK